MMFRECFWPEERAEDFRRAQHKFIPAQTERELSRVLRSAETKTTVSVAELIALSATNGSKYSSLNALYESDDESHHSERRRSCEKLIFQDEDEERLKIKVRVTEYIKQIRIIG